ncbi:hypothetical protein BVG16_11190 [Paenibacillus selenitireducens]|uniref:Tellurium resistance protein TerC n=1 Tax=Paenibacillus selenitireducens TaxID=1324314 RepID=A0A1T2XF20_9BACL|nr:TerC family protein [Paenibacillus selenitireducens]OPA78435.1 hypothetical protein BVG16_11190 [Paenibacillus selenitireducens]
MENLFLLLEILIINMVLSGDNAVVIAMASKNLPVAQRKKAVWWGAFGAVILRCVLTVAAMYLLKIPLIQAFGSLLLLYIAVKLLMDEDNFSRIKIASSMWKAVKTILVADFVMSLDNVLAIAAVAKGDFGLIVIGIALSIPIIVWGSTIIVNLLHRYPILIYLGSGILGLTAGQMLMEDAKLQSLVFYNWPPILHTIIPVTAAILVIIIGKSAKHYHAHSQ